jgi:RNA polymerase-interacting CarD/CdnL/TRCF family regulator
LFQKGDAIVHPKYGAGTVLDIRTMNYKGTERRYFCIALVHNRGELMIPEDRLEQAGLRFPLRDASRIQAVMEEPPQPLEDDPRARQLELEHKINSGDNEVLMRMLRDLCWREHTAKLSLRDKQLKDSALNKLLEELALDQSTTADAVKLMLEHIIENAMQKHLAVANSGT